MADIARADMARPHERFSRGFGNLALQAALLVIVVGIAIAATHNAAQNLARANIAHGFGFWNNTAGFDISQTLIDYSSSTSTFGRAFWVGLLNTLLVAAHRLRARDRLRLHHRHCAAVAQLAGVAIGRRLCRAHPQHPAAAANPVLVQRRAEIAAGIARQRRACRSAAFSTIAACSCRGRFSRRISAPSCIAFAIGIIVAIGIYRLGAAPSGAHRRAGPHSAGWC